MLSSKDANVKETVNGKLEEVKSLKRMSSASNLKNMKHESISNFYKKTGGRKMSTQESAF